MQAPFNLPLNIYSNGGGTTAASWMGGFYWRLQEHYHRLYGRVDFTGSNFIVSSAAVPASLMLVVSQLTGRSVLEIAECMHEDLYNEVLIARKTRLLTEAGRAIKSRRLDTFSLWTTENYSHALARAFSFKDGTRVTLRHLLNSGINFSIMYTLYNRQNDHREPFIIPLSKAVIYNLSATPNEDGEYPLNLGVDPSVLEEDLGSISGEAMAHPGLLPKANRFAKRLGFAPPEDWDLIDGDLMNDIHGKWHISPSWRAITALQKRGAEVIHWLSTESPADTNIVFQMFAGLDNLTKDIPDLKRQTLEMEGVGIVRHRFLAPKNNPISFAKSRVLFSQGYDFAGERLQYFPSSQSENHEVKFR